MKRDLSKNVDFDSVVKNTKSSKSTFLLRSLFSEVMSRSCESTFDCIGFFRFLALVNWRIVQYMGRGFEDAVWRYISLNSIFR